MIKYLPTYQNIQINDSAISEPLPVEIKGYQKQFSIETPRGDEAETTTVVTQPAEDTQKKIETPTEKVIETPVVETPQIENPEEPPTPRDGLVIPQETKIIVPTRGTITFKGKIDVGNMQEVLDKFAEAGISVHVTSGARKSGEVGKAGNKSHHISGNAIDIVPGKGETWESLKTKIKNNKQLKDWLKSKGIGILDETNQEVMAKTGATGPHLHIGPDKIAREHLDTIFAKFGTKLPKFQNSGVFATPWDNWDVAFSIEKPQKTGESLFSKLRRITRKQESNNSFKGFGGGQFGNAGASSRSFYGTEPVTEYWVRNTPIPTQRSFSEAYAEARKAGLKTFRFNNKLYTTDYDPNAKKSKAEYEDITLNLREILDSEGKPIKDSTRVEPWIGQIPGQHKYKIKNPEQ